jgi:serine/threonine protein kinase
LKGINTISSVHISDFGTAKRMEEKYEPLQGQVGTKEYMSPEVKKGKEFDPFAADGKELEEELI